MKYDVVVVGAGPAGSATARFAARKGLKVVMLDRRKEIGYPVQCGEFMITLEEVKRMFPRCEGLGELFKVPDSQISKGIDAIVMVSPRGRQYRIDFDGYTVDRRKFDKYLVDLALKEGAELRTNTAVKKVAGGKVATSDGDFEGKVIVGADGPLSRVAECASLPRNGAMAAAMTCQVDGDFEPEVKMFFGSVAPGGYAWTIPKRGCANVGLGVQRRHTDEKLKSLFVNFMKARGLEGRDAAGGYVPVSGPLVTTVKGNVLLVGDSAGQVMASNGGGIPTAMICGRIAGEVIGNHIIDGRPLEEYEVRWRRSIGRELRTSRSTKNLADKVFFSGSRLELSMRLIGTRGLARAIRCQRLFL